LKELLQRLSRRPGAFAALIIVSVFINGLALVVPLVVIQILNRYVAHGVTATLFTLSAAAIGAVVLELGFRQTRLAIAGAMAAKPDEALSLANFQLMLSARAGALDALSPGIKRRFLGSADAMQQAFGAPSVAASNPSSSVSSTTTSRPIARSARTVCEPM